MPIRLVATDLDGTLVRTDGSVSARTVAAIAAAEEAGVAVVMVTARPLRWLEGLLGLVGRHGLAILSNGAITWDVAGGALREVHPIERSVGLGIAERIRTVLPEALFAVEAPDGLRLEPGFPEAPGDAPPLGVGPLAEIWVGDVVKLLVVGPNVPDDHFRESVAGAVGADAVATWSMPGLVEISAAGVTKASALARLAESLGIDRTEVAAVGDMPNDLAMIRWAGLGCAVANAHPDVLDAADRVLPTNDADGVAVLLEELR